MKTRLRWKKWPKPTGLAGVIPRQDASDYHDGFDSYATVYQSDKNGYYWTAYGDTIPHKNTSSDGLYRTEQQAKKEASDYVKKYLRP